MYEACIQYMQQVDFVTISIICLCVYLFFNDDNTRATKAEDMQNIELDSISEISFHSDSTQPPDSESEISCSDMSTVVESVTCVSEFSEIQADHFSPDANRIY
jgi:hypothetical protein